MPGQPCSTPPGVVVWGRSVLASALVAGLEARTGFDLEQVDATLPAVLSALRTGRTQAVVCDLDSVPAARLVALLAERSQLSVVIVDPDADHAIVLTSRRAPMRTIDDLVAAMLDELQT
jgi:hypothetical protein